MREKILLKVALISSIVGLVVLFFISGKIGVSEISIEKINNDNLGEIVKIKGKVENVADVGTVTFLSVSQPSLIDVIIFDTNLTISAGSNVEIIGKTEEYNGKLEIIGERIRII